jgi:ATP-dependent exoDNAse (exonuclease V) beta subunit
MNESSVNVNDIDLSRHAVVEASAGTGKTYTIERLVQRLLLETNVSIDQILVVTFTEKATGELKVRLRTALERAARENAEDAERLQPALAHFDQAPIHTIHGFCHRMLQDFALEQGQDFAAQRADDIDLLKRLLREIQRKDWRREFGDQLKSILEGAGFDREAAGDWNDKVLRIAARYQPRAGHQLRPSFQEEWWRRLADADANPAGQLEVFTIARLRQRLRRHDRSGRREPRSRAEPRCRRFPRRVAAALSLWHRR